MCPWWKPELNDLYAQVPSSNSDAAQLGFQLVQGRGRHEAKSWFSVKSIPLASAVDGPVAVSSSQSKHVNWRVLMDVHPDDVWSEETGAAFKDATASKGTKPESQPIKQVGCRKTCMRLTREQKRLLRKWMGAYAVEKATAAMVAEERVQVTRVTVDMDLATVVVGVKEGVLEAVDLEAVDSEVAEKVVAGLEEVARETVTVEVVAPDPCS